MSVPLKFPVPIFLVSILMAFNVACKKTDVQKPAAQLPTVITTQVSAVTQSGATAGGSATSDSAITEKGICYGTDPMPTTANTKIIAGKDTGSFSCNLTGLLANTNYYVRAYATNSAGTGYGNQQIFETLLVDSATSVYMVAGSQLYAFNAKSGALKWTFNFENQAGGTAYFNGLLYVYSNYKLYALDTTGNLKWTTALPGTDITMPIFYNNNLYMFVNNSGLGGYGTVYALSATTGAKIWSSHVDQTSIPKPFTATETACYVVAGDSLYSFNSQTGVLNWSANESVPYPFYSPPFVLNDKLYLLSGADLYTYNKTSGVPEWVKSYYNDLPLGSSSGTIYYNNGIMYCDMGGFMEAVDTSNGSKLFSFGTTAEVGCFDNNIFYTHDNQIVSTFNASNGSQGRQFGCYLLVGGLGVLNGLAYYGTVYDTDPSNSGHVFCKNVATNTIIWESTVTANFNSSYPCIITQAGKSYTFY